MININSIQEKHLLLFSKSLQAHLNSIIADENQFTEIYLQSEYQKLYCEKYEIFISIS